jgi:hypothetical protein
MQCMGSGKRNQYYFGVVIFFIAVYLFFLLFDNHQQKQQLELQQQQQLDKIKENNIEAFIFGGSNAVNGLSARQLSNALGLRYHNAAMSSELRTNLNYNKYILDIASVVNKHDIKEIVYSSVLPYSNNSIQNYIQGGLGVDPKIIPNISGAGYLKEYFFDRFRAVKGWQEVSKDELIFNEFGDYTNPEKKCLYNKYGNTFEPENIEDTTSFLVDKSYFLSSNFPNSKIYIVLPSLYYSLPSPKFLIHTEILKENFRKKLSLLYPEISSRINFIIQPLYPQANHVCNDPHHASALGRIWRTNNLLSFIQNQPN